MRRLPLKLPLPYGAVLPFSRSFPHNLLLIPESHFGDMCLTAIRGDWRDRFLKTNPPSRFFIRVNSRFLGMNPLGENGDAAARFDKSNVVGLKLLLSGEANASRPVELDRNGPYSAAKSKLVNEIIWWTPSFATMRSSVRSRLAPPSFHSLAV
jgi:hypothetical protein